jgi:hypothetical protein
LLPDLLHREGAEAASFGVLARRLAEPLLAAETLARA